MQDASPGTTFRGLPLTPEQHSEIRHYIHQRERAGKEWDTPELHAMLADMLDPPETATYSRTDDEVSTATGRRPTVHDDDGRGHDDTTGIH